MKYVYYYCKCLYPFNSQSPGSKHYFALSRQMQKLTPTQAHTATKKGRIWTHVAWVHLPQFQPLCHVVSLQSSIARDEFHILLSPLPWCLSMWSKLRRKLTLFLITVCLEKTMCTRWLVEAENHSAKQSSRGALRDSKEWPRRLRLVALAVVLDLSFWPHIWGLGSYLWNIYFS